MVSFSTLSKRCLLGLLAILRGLAMLFLLLAGLAAQAAPSTPTEDFLDNGDGTVTHLTTGLTWMRCALGMTWDGTTCAGTASTYTWDQAKALTATFAGKSDWRLPSIAELNSIVERNGFNPAINTTIFPNTPSSFFWSGSPISAVSNSARGVGFDDGADGYGNRSNSHYVRLVRDGQLFDPLLPNTPDKDFVDNGDGTVMHLKTGLMWKRCAEGQTWSGTICTGTNNAFDWNAAMALTSSSAGHTDWRLPTTNELLSIVEYQNVFPAINSSIFPNTPSLYYFWSGSPYASNSSNVWVVGFHYGFTNFYRSSSSYLVRLVRGGQFFAPLGFTPQAGVAPGSTVTSTTLKVVGLAGATAISIVGGSYSINGGAYTSASGTVNPGDSVAIRVVSASSHATATRAILTIGGVSAPFRITTAAVSDTLAPDAPPTLLATTRGSSMIELSWGAASDNVGVSAYRVYRNDTLVVTLGAVTRYLDNGLAAATSYRYRVVACDAAGYCSQPSEAAAATTSAADVASTTTPTEDFIDNGDGTVTHLVTGLTWMRCALGMFWDGTTCAGTGRTYAWDQARALTATFAGRNDWRLPSIAELNSIVERYGYAQAINTTIFPKTPSSYFWSGSPYAPNSNMAWVVFFYDGYGGDYHKSYHNYVRLVRGEQSFDPLLPNTPDKDFVDNGDGTVMHLKTGLMWKRCAEGQTWNGTICTGTNNAFDWNTAMALTSSSAGHTDWRLPTVNELLSIVEYQNLSPAISTTIFPKTLDSTFWSGSPNASNSNDAWYVRFYDGYVRSNSDRSSNHSVRLVRGGRFFAPLGFTSQSGVAPGSTVTSNTLKVAGLVSATAIAIVGGSYSINGGAFTAAPGTVNPGDSVAVRVVSASSLATTTRATLTIGGVSGPFRVTTLADVQAPQAPSGLTATAATAGQVDLAWNSSTDGVGVTAYRLYRNGLLLAVLGNVTRYRDTPAVGALRVAYRVVACDAASNCSAPSDVASLVLPASSKTTPVLAAGAKHGAGVTDSGALLLWGDNESGQIGSGGSGDFRSVPFALDTGVVAVAPGGNHSLAIKHDGSLWAWGGNASGQLGDDSTVSSTTPKQIGSGYIAIAAGQAHSLAIKDDGSLWAWGNNGSGRLGDGTANSSTAPVQIGSGYYAVAAGTSHSLGIKTDGSLWTWGSNVRGQLGDGSFSDRYLPTQIGSGFVTVAAGVAHSLALKTDGSLWAWGKLTITQVGNSTAGDRPTPDQIGNGFKAVAAGASHSVGLKTDGTVWTWGSNAAGQLGAGGTVYRLSPDKVEGLANVIAIAAGGNFTLVLKADGTVYAWGGNASGQLGDGTFSTRTEPVLVANATIDGPLDLLPEVANIIPADKIPPFYVVASKSGDLSALSLSVDVKGMVPSSATRQFGSRAAGGYNVYVAAQTAGEAPTWFRLDEGRSWGKLEWPISAFMRGVALDSQDAKVRVDIFQGANLTSVLGAEFYVGYGTDAEEMASAQRYRKVFTAVESKAP